MDTLHARADWEPVGERWFRKTEHYSNLFDDDLDLNHFLLVGAPYGGALALWRDQGQLRIVQPGSWTKPAIDIYSLAGRKLRSLPWDKGSIKGLGWSDDESLIAVTADGNVRCYDLEGDFSHFSLGHGAHQHGVESCRFYHDGMVALLGNRTFVAVSSYSEPRPKLLASAPEGDIHSWAIISPRHTLSRSVEVLVSIGATVYVLDAADCQDRFLDIGPFSHMTVSPDGRWAALFDKKGRAHLVSSDFQEKLFEHDSGSQTAPREVGWCGSDAVIAWEDEVRVIGPGDQSASFIFDSTRVHLVSELDGARLITNDSCDFLERVPDDSLAVFGQAAESSPASILLDAAGQLEAESPKADDYIQLIRPSLAEAVDGCINAAGREFDSRWQKRLLKAASFGKSVLDLYNSDEFVDMCETLRVLNAVRSQAVGLPLSLEQYHRLTAEGLIRRLLGRRQYLLALKISTFLKLPSEGIYVHWACAKVRAGAEDEETTCRLVVDRLSGKGGISFEQIARAAYHEGRTRLATELLNHEPRGGRQVPLLLEMEEEELALEKAIESGDTDLMLSVLLQLKKKLPLATFLRLTSGRPMASAMVEMWAAREGDDGLLKDLFYQDDRRLEGAKVFIGESLEQPEVRTASDKLALAAKLLAESRETTAEVQALKETTMLLRLQEKLEREVGEAFVGLSVNETMAKLIRLGHHAQAKKMQADFRVTETVAWWIRLRALVAKREWSEIEEMAKAKKSPIGWEPFFNMTLQAGNPRLAAMFVGKCTGLERGEKVRMYEKCGMRVKAAEEAVRIKDEEAWRRLLEAAGRTTHEGREIEALGNGLFRK